MNNFLWFTNSLKLFYLHHTDQLTLTYFIRLRCFGCTNHSFVKSFENTLLNCR